MPSVCILLEFLCLGQLICNTVTHPSWPSRPTVPTRQRYSINSPDCERNLLNLNRTTAALQTELDDLKYKNFNLESQIDLLRRKCTCLSECHYGNQSYFNGDSWYTDTCTRCTCRDSEVHCSVLDSSEGCGFQCDESSCFNGGYCHSGPTADTFACECPSGFTGPLCEYSVSRCVSHKTEGNCIHENPAWFFDPSTNQCTSTTHGCYDQNTVFPSEASCSSACTRGTCCYRTSANSDDMICEEESLVDCQSLCHNGDVEVVGFYPGAYCSAGNCFVKNYESCHTGTELHWPGSTFSFGCETCQCLEDRIACKCNMMSVRREIRELSRSERQRFQRAVASLQNMGLKSPWASFRDLYATYIMHSHSPSYFLLWHRLFLRNVERHLQQVDCSVTIPYFDFTLDAGHLAESIVWQDSYFGRQHCSFSPESSNISSPMQCIDRKLSSDFPIPTMVEVAIALANANYPDFTAYMQDVAGYLHSFVGGDMETAGSPADPVFYSIHAYIDLLFWRWQQRHQFLEPDDFPDDLLEATLLPFNTAVKHTTDLEKSLCVSYGIRSFSQRIEFPIPSNENDIPGTRHRGDQVEVDQGAHPCSFDSEKEFEYECTESREKAALDIGYRVQEVLYAQNEDFLRTLPRSCPSLRGVPNGYLNQVWHEPKLNMKDLTRFQKIRSQSELGNRFCFTADLFLPEDGSQPVSCQSDPVAVCDMSVLSSCPFYPHSLCKLSLCGNCTASCHVNGQEVQCADRAKDLCQPNPCQNNGYCQPSVWPAMPHLVTCKCQSGYEGKYCEHTTKQRCYLPVDYGEMIEGCGLEAQRWYFNPETQDCHAFWFNGCFGNSNNFQSYYDCRISCIIGACCWRTPLYPNTLYGFSEEGYDRYGFNANGYSRNNKKRTKLDGFGGDRAMYRHSAFDYQGYNQEGFNKNGLDRFGYDSRGYHHITKFNLTGYDIFGDYDGIIDFDESGYDSDGYNRAGLNCYGISRDGWDYYGLGSGWKFECRAMNLRDCQNIESEFPHLHQEVVSFSPGKKCEEVQCWQHCGCDFLGQSYAFKSQIPLGCGTCECRLNGRVHCPCTTTYVRKEIRDLTPEELHRYQKAVKVLNNGESSVWMNLTQMYENHIPQSRGGPHFLPWHRFYLRLIEMKLQEIDCAITIPYFDWTMDSGDLETSLVWQANYFGSDGDSEHGNCVQHHPFKDYISAHFIPCLRRQFNSSVQLPDAIHMEMILRESSYDTFRLRLEAISSLFHLFVGGHMSSPASAYDPIFLSHYAFLDKLWYDWEHSNADGNTQYPSKLRYIPMVPFGVTPDDVLLSEIQTCVIYADITEGAPCHMPSESDTLESEDFFSSDLHDINGFNAEGYHTSGFDKMGWTRDGFFRDSFNRDGFDVFGFDHSGFNRYGFSSDGCSSDLCSVDPLEEPVSVSMSSETFSPFGYNAVGLDYHGYDAYGFNTQGYDKNNCSYFFQGPFYPIFMKKAKQQFKKMTDRELQTVERICIPVSSVPDWWLTLSWLNRNSQRATVQKHEQDIMTHHSYDSEMASTKFSFYDGWLPPTPDEQFCFQLYHQSGCNLNEPPVPCPLQNCENPVCTSQPIARCRQFGCGSCDMTYFDIASKQQVACNSLDCISMEGSSHKEGEIWKEDLCETCMCQEGHVTCSVMDCEDHMLCQHPIRKPDVCCPVCEGCEFEGESFANNAEFLHPRNPCFQCVCINGTAHCTHMTCPQMPPCEKHALVILPGECCPICSMCGPHSNGSNWMESPCHNCSCKDGQVQCSVIECSAVHCRHPWRPSGHCCRSCDGCEYEGLVMNNREIFKPDPCNECQCKDGEVTCQRTQCSTPNCLHPITPRGECCAVCPKECEYEGKTYNHGDIFAPDFNPCLNCSCQDSLVRCHPAICPQLDPPCRNPVVPPGKCCAVCPNCTADGRYFINGARWKDPKNPCSTCVCMDGLIVCSKKDTCEEECTHGQIPAGECCSPCTDCLYEGRLVMDRMQFSPPDDPCTRCICRKGSITCSREACPQLLCRKTEQPPGACCPVCKACTDVKGHSIPHGHQWVHPSDICQMCMCNEGISRCERKMCDVRCRYPVKRPDRCCPECHRCQYEGKIYHSEAEVPSKDPCKRCICYGGNIKCESVTCPHVTCERPEYVPGQCCPTCSECRLHGETYKNGEVFHPPADPCYNCTCEMGVLHCRKIDEFCNAQCSHPLKISGQCCPVCDGCEYERKTYQNGQKFKTNPTEPCQECECINGNVHCKVLQCPHLPCPNPTKSEGECCGHCSQFCTDATTGQSIRYEGEVWNHADDQCQMCTCKHSVVQCEKKLCPPVDCPHPAAPFGECCPTCDHCQFSRRLYRNGQDFPHVDDPCQMCVCQNGTVSCTTLICDPLPCMNPTPVEGHCCPVCLPESGCQHLGKFYEPWEKFIDPDQPCLECMCADGAITCHQDLCPQAGCPNPVYSHCCDNCDGCSYGERNYMNHIMFPDPYNPCRQCQCDNGAVSCQQQPCPPVMCRNPVMVEHECCPVCKECFYSNKLYEDGEIFMDPSNPCLECRCQYPTVHCYPQACPSANCTNPVDDNCCKHCSDCSFENELYEDGTSFTHPEDSCSLCSCVKGNIRCKEKTCPPVTCTHPVPGDCCDECRADCWLDGARYTHWQVFPHPQNPCKECICKKGSIICKPKKCPPVKCLYPSQDQQCCPSCTDCFYKGELILNGRTVDHDGSNRCSTCRCQNGNIKCQSQSCPTVYCSNPVIKDCCPVCNIGCFYNDQVYNFGAEFDHPTDPCSECACMDGTVHCALKPCDPVPCTHPVKIEGHCCPECPTYCIYNGSKRLNGSVFPQVDDSCNECKCLSGNIQCYKKSCRFANCKHPAPGKCCIECQDCQYLGKVYLDEETFPNPEEACETCTCKKGEVSCKRYSCPSLTCPVMTRAEGHCCPVCVTSCKVENQVYEHGDTFTPMTEKCQKCICLEGQVVCKTEICAQCTHPIPNPGQCCPSCDGCNYNGLNYSNQERFTALDDPCEECICKNGSMTCHHLACSHPPCAHPVLPEGQCCPVCQEPFAQQQQHTNEVTTERCSVSGIKFEEGKSFTNPENPCEECICLNGNAVCKAQPCQWNCTNPLPDPCCPICDGCLFEGNSYTNGQKFHPDPCRTCLCRDGTVSCVSETCPELRCQLRTRIPDQCCEVCRGCVYEGIEYENGDHWVSSANPCLSCQCIGGTITCSQVHCLVPCAKPRPIPGRCCPVCPECIVDGKVYKSGDVLTPDDSPCDTCTCDSGELVCISRQCPSLGDCPRNAIRPPSPGECCPTCAGFSSKCTKEQIGHLVQPTADPCLVCQCAEDFSWICSREICPSFYCPKKEVLNDKDVCCPKCNVCTSETEDEVRRHGSSWSSETDPCVICTCEFGIVQCTDLICPETECKPGEIIHRPQGECCDVCLPFDHLSCQYGEMYYTNGQVWNPEPCILCRCSFGKTTCQTQRCVPLSCPSDEIPSVDPGQCCPKCIPRPATCVAFGDPHYRTFDGAIIHFQGTCRYILAADCVNQQFSVIVENSDRGFRGVSWTERVVLVLPNTTVDLRKGPVVHVKGKPIKNLPYFDNPVLYIENTGSSVLVTTDAGVKVLWNGDSYVEVIASGVYRTKTCGLCGNFNNYPQDDMRLPTGQIVTSAARFGNSWKNRGGQPAKCTEAVDLDPCSARGYRARRIANSKCSVLKGRLFVSCHSLIPPEPYFASCVYDVCACSENDDCLCDILSAYSLECAKAGVILSWRSAGFCDLQCREDEGLMFDECGPPCPRTCENKDVPVQILAAQCFKHCVPGCQCSADKVLHNGRCIPMRQCP